MPKHKSHHSPSRDRKHRRSRSASPRHRSVKEEHRSKESHRSTHYKDAHSSSKHNRSTGQQQSAEEPLSFLERKSELDRLFFTDRDAIKKGTPVYDEFWKFYAKYQAMQVRQGATAWEAPQTQPLNELGVPSTFHRSFLLNVRLNLPPPEKLLARLEPQSEGRRPWTRHQLMEFHQIVQLYLEFLQREKTAKLKKLRQAQRQLPIAQFRDDIVATVRANQITIIAGDTGCGKSTQVPQYLLQAGFSRVACTQPRRIACISLSKRVAFETLNEYGSQVGYQIRFEKTKTQNTRIVFVTEGLLLRQISTDPMLSDYDIVVLDEVHERHLSGDFLLGVVNCLVRSRPDLKLILMSATINIELFQNYFQGRAPVIQVPGRLFPIQVQYMPISAEDRGPKKSSRLNPAPYLRVLQLIDAKYPKEERGDVLVFLSGLQEIETVAEAVREYALQNQRWIVLPLHSALSIAEQDKVFDYPPEGVRKCIISTNIAETSVTIDGVRFVIDSGKVKEMNHDPISKLQRLQEFWISRASAEQRKGRAGRTGPGVCYRLFSEKQYAELAPYSTPEIQRVPLDSMVLQMVSMGLPDARRFPFIEPPSVESIENSICNLKEKEALTVDERMTQVGECLAGLPVDITIGKMLLMGSLFHQVEAVLALAAALSVQSPFTNRAHRDADCEAARKPLDSDHGDPLTLLNAYRAWLEIKAGSEASQSRKWCRKRGFEEQRFYEMTKLRQQFRNILKDAGLLPAEEHATSAWQRSQRHGELQHLRSLKRTYQRSGQKKRRVLKLGQDADDADDDGGDDDDDDRDGDQDPLLKDGDPTANIDIRDVEFRLQNDASQIRSLASGVASASVQDVMLLKLILCSGLSPQFSVADEFNNYKSTSEQIFHTRAKPFTILHPMSVYASQPDVLQLQDYDIIDVPGFPSKHPVSSKHQVLAYVTLLETNKLYQCTTMRMPAAQTLLLFSSVDTNADLSRIVCDGWIELHFADAAKAQALLYRACQLRHQWHHLLTLRLDKTVRSTNETKAFERRLDRLQKRLQADLMELMHKPALYTLKRLLAADLKHLYIGAEGLLDADDRGSDLNPFWPQYPPVPHATKGGLQMADFLVYACLEDPDTCQDYLSTPWCCPHCAANFYLTGLGRLRHQVQCQSGRPDQLQGDEGDEAAAPEAGASFFCAHCRTTLSLTGIELLRHKRRCAADAAVAASASTAADAADAADATSSGPT